MKPVRAQLCNIFKGPDATMLELAEHIHGFIWLFVKTTFVLLAADVQESLALEKFLEALSDRELWFHLRSWPVWLRLPSTLLYGTL